MNEEEKCVKIEWADDYMWYADLVGKTIPYYREEKDCYIVRDTGGYTNILFKKHTLPITSS
jgi:hypothetical protein